MDVNQRMRADWNRRAREDAHFYVAFGRRSQQEQEFLASAAEVTSALERESFAPPARFRRPRSESRAKLLKSDAVQAG